MCGLKQYTAVERVASLLGLTQIVGPNVIVCESDDLFLIRKLIEILVSSLIATSVDHDYASIQSCLYSYCFFSLPFPPDEPMRKTLDVAVAIEFQKNGPSIKMASQRKWP